MHELTAFQRDLLYVVAGMDEPKGLAVRAELQTYYESEINHGRLYPNLDSLAEKGLVEKGKRDERTNTYQITQHGQQVLTDRREWERQYVESTAPSV